MLRWYVHLSATSELLIPSTWHLRCSPEPRKTARVQVSERERAALTVEFTRGKIAYSLSARTASSRKISGGPYAIGWGSGLFQ